MHFNANIVSLVILFCGGMTANASPFPQHGAAALVNGEGTVKTSRPVNAAGAATVPTSRSINPDGFAATPTPRPINPDGSAAYVIKLTIFKSSLTPHSRDIIALLKARFAQAPPVNGDGAAKTSRPVNTDVSAATKTARPVNPDGSAATPTPRPVNADGAAI
jgi:hypothetical protein